MNMGTFRSATRVLGREKFVITLECEWIVQIFEMKNNTRDESERQRIDGGISIISRGFFKVIP